MSQSSSITVVSAVIRSEKPNKPIEAIPAPNPHQGNRIIGYMPDGRKVVVAHRPNGKGGMDFNKIAGGKTFAVAADGLSPVMEKDEGGKTTRNQKQESGLPLFSASGFYLLSSKDYPALDMFEAYTRLLAKGGILLSLTQEEVNARQCLSIESDFDLDMLETSLGDLLSDSHSLVARFDADINKRREKDIRRAKEDAEDRDEVFNGVEFKPLAASPKDGKPFVSVAARIGTESFSQCVVRQVEMTGADGKPRVQHLSAEEAVRRFKEGPLFSRLTAALQNGEVAEVALAQGYAMRTSVSFRRKVENVLAGVANPSYGDAVYIKAALDGWVKGIVSLMHSMHPSFPKADYDAHYYVAAPRQAEVAMTKLGSGWAPPIAPHYSMAKLLLAG